MPLFQRRRALAEKADRLAKGESKPLTNDFDTTVRTKLLYAIIDNTPSYLGDPDTPPFRVLMPIMRRVLLREWAG
jgi:hypothetical protein